MAQWIADGVLVCVLATAVVTDLLRGRIYNWLTYPAVLAGLTVWMIAGWVDGGLWGGLDGLRQSLVGMLAVFVPMVIAFYLGGIGGGDAKLAGAIGALGKTWLAIYGLFYGFLVGGLIAVGVMIARRAARRTMGRVWRFVWLLATGGRPVSPTDAASPRIATALPWAIGTVWALIEMRWCGGWHVLDWLVGR